RGCYARVLQAAVDQSALSGCTAVLGFVTADNPTGRGLRRLGATEVPSAYIASPRIARVPGTVTLRPCSATAANGWPAHASARLRRPPLPPDFHYPPSSPPRT